MDGDNGSRELAPSGSPLEHRELDRHMREISRLTGDSIRGAIAHANRHIMTLVVEAEQQVAIIRQSAEEFCQNLEDVGEAHASRIEGALADLRVTANAIQAERDRVSTLAKART